MQGRFGQSATLFPLVLILFLSGVTFWLDIASRAPAGQNDGKTRHDPDYMVENFELRRFSPEGNLQHTLRAPLMRHYPDDDSTTVLSPDLTYHRIPPTNVKAREARLDSKAKHVELIEDVRITRGGIKGKPDSVLTTSRLDAYPDDETATTREPVTITQGRTVVNGSGLDADNKTQIYVMEGPVHGIFFKEGKDGGAAKSPIPPAPLLEEPVKPQLQIKPPAQAKPPKTKPKTTPSNKPKPKTGSQTKKSS